ncbi:hypothetical protein [Stutzerimonas xanthomarina]|uniref:hypothetical protein n=1 Tax=Stutzerimonas xanthomarina TaxID=271420 RepID=UPI003AA9DEB2
MRTAVRMLDNVIDINYYSTPQAQNANFKHRPVGLGIMASRTRCTCSTSPTVPMPPSTSADKSMEAISYFAIQASCDLADERGAHSSFQGSLWSQWHPAAGLPADPLIEARGQKYIDVDLTESPGLGADPRARQERHPQLQHHGYIARPRPSPTSLACRSPSSRRTRTCTSNRTCPASSP